MVKLTASCLGWLEVDQEKALAYLSNSGFYGIEVVGNKFFGSNYIENIKECLLVKQRVWEQYQLKMEVAQAVWYGLRGSIFTIEQQSPILEFNKKLLHWAAELGLKTLVLGAPQNRKIPDLMVLDKEKSYAIAVDFFQKLGDLAHSFEVCFALEPVNTVYDCNFLTTTVETLQFVKQLNHRALGMNFDFGSWLLEDLSTDSIDPMDMALIKHIHISKPYLKAIESVDVDPIQQVLKILWTNQLISLEMLNQSLEDFKSSVINTQKIGNFYDHQ